MWVPGSEVPDSRAFLQKRTPGGDSDDSDSEEPVRLQLHVTVLRDERVARQFCVTAEAETTVAELGARVVPTRPRNRKGVAEVHGRSVRFEVCFRISRLSDDATGKWCRMHFAAPCVYIRAILAGSPRCLDSLRAGVPSEAPL